MKKSVLLTLVCVFFMVGTASARKGFAVYCSDCEYIVKVHDLPDEDQFYVEETKSHVDLGYIYNQFWVLWVPVWNSNGRYCYVAKDASGEDSYLEIDAEELAGLKEAYKLDVPESPIPFWDKIGGKLIIGALIGFGVYSMLGGKKKDETPETKPDTTTDQA